MRLLATLFLCLALVSNARAQDLALSPSDTTHSVILAQKGKRVTLRLRSGQELTGLVRDASDRLVVLGALAGRELFDAIIPIDSVEALIVRVRPQ